MQLTEKEIQKIEFNFKKMITAEEIPDVYQYICDYMDANRDYDIKLWIGTDSQKTRKRNLVTYATVICIYKVGHGAHIIYSRQRRTDIKDMFTRLWWEVEYSIALAILLRDKGLLVKNGLMDIHLDLSPKLKNKSNAVYKTATGYVESMGFIWQAKPDAAVASYAADLVCHQ
jgi:hypothetical protein